VRTIANTPHRDPRQYLRGAIPKESERRRYQYREDVGAWTKTQDLMSSRMTSMVEIDADLA
jgi:hypothetical protein